MKRRELILLGGAAVAVPLTALAVEAMPVIGFLSSGTPGGDAQLDAAFLRGLGETGYIVGQNVAIEFRRAEGAYDRLRAMAADLVGRKVDVIVAGGLPAAQAAKSATSTIPVIFSGVGDPVGTGLVNNLARPSGNLTGIIEMTTDLMSKRLELVSELVPQATVIALLVNPTNANAEPYLRELQDAARTKRVKLAILKASNESEIDAAFGGLDQLHAGALIIVPDAFFSSRREQLVTLASRHSVPAVYHLRELAAAGGLLSYGASLTANRRQAGTYAGRVLKGERPADLPVQQPTKFELVINLKTAKALGLTVPQSLLARADEVIE